MEPPQHGKTNCLQEPETWPAVGQQPPLTLGEGTAESCLALDLPAELSMGGHFVFDCGPEPVTLFLSRSIEPTAELVLDGAGLVTLDAQHQSRHVTFATELFDVATPHHALRGLRFINGRATGTETRLGIDIDGGGGAIYYYSGSVTVVDCVFEDNEAALVGPDVAGGAIYGVGRGKTTVLRSRFERNRAANGGAIGSLFTGIEVHDSVFLDHTATGFGANYQDENNVQQGSGGDGGAIQMDGQGQALILCGVRIERSSAGALGSAVFRTGYESELVRITDSSFLDNTVRWDDDFAGGGALYLQGNRVELLRSTVARNSAQIFAGVWIHGHGPQAPGSFEIVNSTLAQNSTHPTDGDPARGLGGGLIVGDNTSGLVLNSTLAFNDAQFASGILGPARVELRNSILVNSGDLPYESDNCWGFDDSQAQAASGSGNLQWPALNEWDHLCLDGITVADPDLGELTLTGVTETLAPGPASPAVGAGSDCPATDQRGEPRSEPCTAGAYEVK